MLSENEEETSNAVRKLYFNRILKLRHFHRDKSWKLKLIWDNLIISISNKLSSLWSWKSNTELKENK
jgi:hypothetical protein